MLGSQTPETGCVRRAVTLAIAACLRRPGDGSCGPDRRPGAALAALALLVVACLMPVAAWAADFTVSNGNDSGAGSLRQAIFNSNAAGGSNTITINGAVGTITLTQSLPMITASVAVTGNNTILDANNTGRAIFVQAGTVSVSNLTINNAVANGGNGGSALTGSGGGGLGAGAAVFVNTGASASLTNVSVGNASARGGAGGSSAASVAGSSGAGGGLGGSGGSGGSRQPRQRRRWRRLCRHGRRNRGDRRRRRRRRRRVWQRRCCCRRRRRRRRRRSTGGWRRRRRRHQQRRRRRRCWCFGEGRSFRSRHRPWRRRWRGRRWQRGIIHR